jgi:hypothetical protein
VGKIDLFSDVKAKSLPQRLSPYVAALGSHFCKKKYCAWRFKFIL